jgi:hypothetical protein
MAVATRQAPAQLVDERAGALGAYEDRYGSPVFMSVDTLLAEGVPPSGAVRTFGIFRAVMTPRSMSEGTERDASGARFHYELCGIRSPLRCLRIVPVPEIAELVDARATIMGGHRTVVVGAFQVAAGRLGETLPGFAFWSIDTETEGDVPQDRDARAIGLRRLVAEAGALDGQTLRVVGRFRGRNLFGDLPEASRRAASDWVIQDQGVAVWITGKEPKGAGWGLDPPRAGR